MSVVECGMCCTLVLCILVGVAAAAATVLLCVPHEMHCWSLVGVCSYHTVHRNCWLTLLKTSPACE
jgi:type II secretory pathway component PulL